LIVGLLVRTNHGEVLTKRRNNYEAKTHSHIHYGMYAGL
jgi:hypothetical protein